MSLLAIKQSRSVQNLAMVFLTLLATACGGGGGGGGGGAAPVVNAPFAITPSPVTLTSLDPNDANSRQQLTVTRNGVDVTANSLFTSSNATIASVNNQGLVQAIANGTVTITVSNAGISDTVMVTVNASPNTLTTQILGGAPANFQLSNQTLQLQTTGTFAGLAQTFDLTLAATGTTYTSNNTGAVTVTADGLLAPVANGTATITASNGNQTAQITITVDLITVISFAPPGPIALQVGQTQQLTVIGNNQAMTDVTSAAIGTTYVSSNPALLSIGANGLAMGLGNQAGTATITATNNGLSATITVNVVVNAPTSVDAGSAVAPAGAMVSIPFNLNVGVGDQPVSVQVDFSFDADLSIAAANNITAGAVATAAGATVTPTLPNATSASVVVTNAVTPTVFGTGTLFSVQFMVANGAQAGLKAITINQITITDINANAIIASFTAGSVNVQNIANSTLTAGSVNGNSGGMASVPFDINVGAGATVTQMQVDISFDADLSIPNVNRFLSGAASNNAGATVAGTILSPTTARIIVSNVNPTAINNGTVFNITFDINANALVGNKAISITQLTLMDGQGFVQPSMGVAGNINVQVVPVTTSLTVGTATGIQGAAVGVPVSIAVAAGDMPTAVQIDITFDADLSIANNGQFVPAIVATNAGASVSGNITSPTTATIIVVNTGAPTVFGSGPLFSINFNIAANAAVGQKLVTVTSTLVSNAQAAAIPSQGISGAVTVQAAPGVTTLTVGSLNTLAGATVSIPVDISVAAGAMPTAVQIDLTFDADLSIANNNQFLAGIVAQSAGATINGNVTSPTTASIIVINTGNPTVFGSGTLFTINFAVAANATAGAKAISITQGIVSDANAVAIANQNVDGVVTVQAAPVTTSLAVGTGMSSPGGTVAVPVDLSVLAGDMPTAVQIDISFDSDLGITNNNQFAAGAVATAAGATVTGNVTSPTTASIIVTNLASPTVFASGTLFTINFNVAPNATAGAKIINVTQTIVSDAQAQVIFSQGTPGSVTVVGQNFNTVTVGSATGIIGGGASVPVDLTVVTGAMPTAVQVDITFDADLSIANNNQFTVGTAAAAAGATVTGNVTSPTTASIIVVNTGTPTVFGNGTLFNINFDIAAGATVGLKSITVNQVIVADAQAMALPSASMDGTVLVQAAPNTTTLAIATVNGTAGATTSVPVNLAIAAGDMPTAIQIDISFDADLSIANNNQFTAGAAAIAAGATVTGNVTSPTTASIIVVNTATPTVFGSGALFNINFDVAANAVAGTKAINVVQTIVGNAAAQAINSVGTNGGVNVVGIFSDVIVGTAMGPAGTTVNVPFSLAVGSGVMPTAIQVDISFNADLSIANNNQFIAGAIATAAGANVTGNVTSPTTASIIVVNTATPTVFGSGAVFSINFDIAANALAGSKPITITQSVISNAQAQPLASRNVNGSVTVVGQNSILTVGNVSGNANGTATVPVDLTVAAGAMPTAIQIDISFDADLSIANNNQFVIGGAATAAGATVTGNVTSPTTASIIITNTGTPTVFANGTLFSINFGIAANAVTGTKNITVVQTIISDANALALGSQGVNGSVMVQGAVAVTTLTVGTQTAVAGATVSVPVNLAVAVGDMPTAVQIDISFNADLSIANNNQFIAGIVATNAGATVTGNVAGNTASIVVTNTATPTVFSGGVLFTINFDVAANAVAGTKAITVVQTVVSDANAAAITSVGVDGAVNVQAAGATTLTVGNVSGAPGATVSVPVNINIGAGALPTAVQIDISFNADLSIANNNQFIAGAVATNAGATVTGNVAGNTASIVVTNTGNPTVFATGVLFTINFDINANAAAGSKAITVTTVVVSDANANPLPSQGVDGSVTVAGGTTLTVGNSIGQPGGVVDVPVSLIVGAGDMPVSFQIDITYDSDLSIANNNQFVAGPVATAAGATVTGNVTSATTASVIVANLTTPTVLGPGVVFNIRFNVAANATVAIKTITVNQVIVADAQAMAISAVGINGSVDVQAVAATTTIAVGSATGAAGTSVTVPVSINVAAGDMPTAIQVDITFDADLSIANNNQFTAGASAAAAGATVSGNVTSATTASIIVTNLTTPTVLSSGIVFNIQFDISGAAAAGVKTITVNQAIVSDAAATAITSQSTNGSVTVP